MKSKTFIALAVAGAFTWSGAIAGPEGAQPSHVDEAQPSMANLLSLDRFTGGYKGWGPIANFQGPSAVDESMPLRSVDDERSHKQHVAEVEGVRSQVWMANADLRAPYEAQNIGATKAQAAGGTVRFDSTEPRR